MAPGSGAAKLTQLGARTRPYAIYRTSRSIPKRYPHAALPNGEILLGAS